MPLGVIGSSGIQQPLSVTIPLCRFGEGVFRVRTDPEASKKACREKLEAARKL